MMKTEVRGIKSLFSISKYGDEKNVISCYIVDLWNLIRSVLLKNISKSLNNCIT